MNKADAQSHVDGNRRDAALAREAGNVKTASFRERLASAIEREYGLGQQKSQSIVDQSIIAADKFAKAVK